MSEPTSEPISLRHEGEVAILTIDHPGRRNAMTRVMRQHYRALVHQVMVADPDSRALVLTGAGGHFSAGADIGEMTKRTIPQSREILGEFTAVVRDLAAGTQTRGRGRRRHRLRSRHVARMRLGLCRVRRGRAFLRGVPRASA